MNLADSAYEHLRIKTGIADHRRKIVKYSGHFKNYNANAKYTYHYLQFNLATNWETVDEDIQQGLIESLMVKVYKLKIKTDNMELYENFMKGLSKYAKKHTHDPILEASFNRVNDRFFNGMMDKPNLIWASESFAKLGSYEYGSDTIYISTVFMNLRADEVHFLDFVMYHEMLHKKHQFHMKNGRSHAHTKEFREEESRFGMNEETLNTWLRGKKYSLSKMFKFW
jgi:hypothetical protein